MRTTSPGQIKVVGKSGQISLGKRYAGKTLELQRLDDGSLLLRAVVMVPESQLWTLQEPDRSRISRGLAWAGQTEPQESDSDSLSKEKGGAGAGRVAAGRGRAGWTSTARVPGGFLSSGALGAEAGGWLAPAPARARLGHGLPPHGLQVGSDSTPSHAERRHGVFAQAQREDPRDRVSRW
jgi:hypothetical protein